MSSSTARLRGVSVSPQKARLVANLVRGRDVSEAIEMLTFTRKKTAPIIRKLVESAVANAEQADELVDVDDLYIEAIRVDMGPRLRRFRPRAQGRATRILKHTSHITVVLGTRE
jgi:large subunit ribosomal protein L22